MPMFAEYDYLHLAPATKDTIRADLGKTGILPFAAHLARCASSLWKDLISEPLRTVGSNARKQRDASMRGLALLVDRADCLDAP